MAGNLANQNNIGTSSGGVDTDLDAYFEPRDGTTPTTDVPELLHLKNDSLADRYMQKDLLGVPLSTFYIPNPNLNIKINQEGSLVDIGNLLRKRGTAPGNQYYMVLSSPGPQTLNSFIFNWTRVKKYGNGISDPESTPITPSLVYYAMFSGGQAGSYSSNPIGGNGGCGGSMVAGVLNLAEGNLIAVVPSGGAYGSRAFANYVEGSGGDAYITLNGNNTDALYGRAKGNITQLSWISWFTSSIIGNRCLQTSNGGPIGYITMLNGSVYLSSWGGSGGNYGSKGYGACYYSSGSIRLQPQPIINIYTYKGNIQLGTAFDAGGNGGVNHPGSEGGVGDGGWSGGLMASGGGGSGDLVLTHCAAGGGGGGGYSPGGSGESGYGGTDPKAGGAGGNGAFIIWY